MSKRPGAVSAETKEAILASAREEFSQYGFAGSSLRRISAAAGVTTGAVYFFFQGKEDLFREVLAGVTGPLERVIGEHYASERDFRRRQPEVGRDNDLQVVRWLIDFYFDHQQSFDIFLHHMDHPAVEHFMDRLTEQSTDHYLSLLQMAGARADPFGVHLFVHMQLDALLTLLSHGFTREETLARGAGVIRMLRGAFLTLMET